MPKILIIEDDEDTLLSISALLKNHIPHATVITASSAAEGLKKARQESPDTILSDIVMSGTDGCKICHKLKSDKITKHIPIIMLTSLKTDSKSRTNALQSGADAFLTKPIDHAELTAQVNNMLRIKQAEDKLKQDKENLEQLDEKTKLLHQSEQRLLKAQQVAKLGFLDWNLKTNEIFLSDEIYKLYGLKKGEIKTTPELVASVVHPDDLEFVQKNLELAVRGEKKYDIDHRIVRPDGSIVWTHSQAELIRDEQGKPATLLGTSLDITERKQAENALRSMATKFSATSGLEFFEQVCQHLTQTLQLEYAFIGELVPGEDKVSVRTGIGKGKPIEPFLYDLAGAPCENVVGQRLRCYTQDVQGQFPEDHLLAKMGIESYAGMPLFDRSGAALGIMVLLDSKPLANVEICKQLLQIFADRVAAEMERIQAGEALRQSEEKYRTLYNSIRDAILVADTQRNIIDCNAAFTSLFGYSLDEISGEQTLIVYKNEEEFAELGQALQEHSPDKPFLKTVNYRKKTGEVFPGETNVFYFKDDAGEITGFIGLIRDITQRKQAEEALQESENRFRRLFEDLGDAVFVTKIGGRDSGRILEVNPAAEKQTGYSRDELIGMNISKDLAIPESAEIDFNEWDKKLLQGKFVTTPEIKRKKDGSQYWTEVTVTPIEFKGLRASLSINHDITQRKQAEEALKLSEQKFRGIFDESVAAIYLFDAQKNFIDTNQAGIDLLGYTREELLKMSIPEVDAEPVAVLPAHKELLSGDKIVNYEHKLRKKDGTIITVLNNSRPIIDAEGKVIGMQSTLIDISKRKKAEQKINHLNQVLRAIRDVNQLIAREKDRKKLIQKACNLLIETRDLNSAWLMLFDENQKFEEIAQTGFGDEFSEFFKQVEKGVFNECSLRALQKSSVITIDDPKSECGNCPFLGVSPDKCAMTTRLEHEGKIYGLLSVQTPAEFASYDEEKDLLFEVAGDIAFALHDIESEKERKKALAALQQSEEKFRTITVHSPVGMFLDDAEGNAIYINERCAALVGMPADRALNLDWAHAIHPDDRERVTSKWFKSVKNGEPFAQEYRWVHEDGKVVWTRGEITPVKDQNGKVTVFIGTLVDITERKQAEEENKKNRMIIDKNRALLRAILESPQGMIIFALNTKYQYIAFTSQHKKVMKNIWGKDIAIGMNMLDVITKPEDREKAKKNFDKTLKGEHLLSIEEYGDESLRRSFWEDRYAPIYEQGKIVGLSVFVIDITERKLAEEQLQKSLKEKEILLKEIYHRVKNNLAVVSGLLNLQSRYLKDKDAIAAIHKTRTRISSMAAVHSLLSYSEDYSTIDYKKYLKTLVTNIFHSSEKREQVKLRLDLDEITLSIDKAIPCGLLLNEIVTNSLKHAFPKKRKGTLQISMHSLKNKNCEIIVKDDGVGIPKDFDIKKTKSLGLKLINLMTEQIDGTLEIISEKGTTFRISFNTEAGQVVR